jgi:hypothetical protein
MHVSLTIDGERYQVDQRVGIHIADLKSQITQLRKEVSMQTPIPLAAMEVRTVPVEGSTVRPFGNKK